MLSKEDFNKIIDKINESINGKCFLSDKKLNEMNEEQLLAFADVLANVKVTYLRLYKCNLSEMTKDLWIVFGNVLAKTEVVFLDLSNNNLGEMNKDQLAACGDALADTKVKSLGLAYNQLFKMEKEQWMALGDPLGKSGKINFLHLEQNNLGRMDDESWPAFCQVLAKVKGASWDLSENALYTVSSKNWTVFGNILENTHIPFLDLSGSAFWGNNDMHARKEFYEALAKFRIDTLKLNCVSVIGGLWDWVAFGKVLAASEVKKLYLKFCNLNEMTQEQWYDFKGTLGSNVTFLNLRDNNLDSMKVEQFEAFSEVLAASCVAQLDISSNNLASMSAEKWIVFCKILASVSKLNICFSDGQRVYKPILEAICLQLVSNGMGMSTLVKLAQQTDDTGNTLLHLMAKLQTSENVLSLMQNLLPNVKKELLLTKNDAGWTVLDLLVYNHKDSPELLEYALASLSTEALKSHIDSELTLENDFKTTFIHLYAQYQKKSAFQSLLKKIMLLEDLSIIDGYARTPLHIIMEHQTADNVNRFFEYVLSDQVNQNVWALDNNNQTPLYIAATRTDDSKILENLIQYADGSVLGLALWMPTLIKNPDDKSKQVCGSNVLHRIMLCFEVAIVQQLVEKISAYYLKKALLSENSRGVRPLDVLHARVRDEQVAESTEEGKEAVSDEDKLTWESIEKLIREKISDLPETSEIDFEEEKEKCLAEEPFTISALQSIAEIHSPLSYETTAAAVVTLPFLEAKEEAGDGVVESKIVAPTEG